MKYNKISNIVTQIIEQYWSPEVYSVLTASMINTEFVTGNRIGFIILPRRKVLDIRTYPDAYNIEVWLGQRESQMDGTKLQTIDNIMIALRSVLRGIAGHPNILLTNNSDVTIYDEIEGSTVKGYIYLTVNIDIIYYD